MAPIPRFSSVRRRALWFLLAAMAAAAHPAHAVVPSRPAPDFTLPSSAGENLRLGEQRGQVVMINFWATWCGPCKREMPQLNRIYTKYRKAGFVLLGVNVDEDQRNAQGVATRLGVQFPVLFDSAQRVSRLYELNTMPSTVLIDRDGRVRYVHLGYRDGLEDAYEKQVAELLKE
jgi:peroxiredoxin